MLLALVVAAGIDVELVQLAGAVAPPCSMADKSSVVIDSLSIVYYQLYSVNVSS